jgi:hypothetical protein
MKRFIEHSLIRAMARLGLQRALDPDWISASLAVLRFS